MLCVKRIFLIGLACISLSVCRAEPDVLPRRGVFGAAVADDPHGVRITAIVPGSPAATSGLKIGDVLTQMGAHPVATPADFLKAVHQSPVSTPLQIAVLRDGRTTYSQVVLIPAPTEVADSEVTTEYSSIVVDGSLRRTLITVPTHLSGPRPALLLIGGIGCFSIDNPADPHDPYRYLAHDLTRRVGLIVMRVEKAGIGDSQGGPCFTTDFNHESQMYAAAFDALVRDPRVDSKRVFLFGHSIGTLIAPRLALKRPVAGIIVAEAVGINWFEYELANLRRQSVLSGDGPAETDDLLRSKEVCMHRLLIQHETESVIEAEMPDCKKRNTYPVAAPYMQQVAALNIAEPWTRITVPVLAIYGTADFVTSEVEHQRIVGIVNAQRPGNGQLQLVDGMDHHLAIMGTPQHAYDVRVKQHGDGEYAAGLSTIVIRWISDQLGSGR